MVENTLQVAGEVNATEFPFLENTTDIYGNATTPCLNDKNDYCLPDEDYLSQIEDFLVPSPIETAVIVLYTLVFTIGVVGNFLVCFAVWRNHHMRTVTNFFIVNLAIADFMVTLICLPPTLLEDVRETWYFGNIMCKIVKYLQLVSISVSVLTLSAISVERWYAICHPLMFMSTAARARAIIFIIWIVSLLLGIPELVTLQAAPKRQLEGVSVLLTKCIPNWNLVYQNIFQISIMIVLYIIPLSLTGFCYTQIARCLWINVIPGVSDQSTYANSSTSRAQSDPGAENQLQSRRKAAKMLIAVVIMFAICYLPVHLLNILRYAGITKRMGSGSRQVTALFSHWLCYFNSAINPVIYNFMSAKFRKEFSSVCTCCFRVCMRADAHRRGYGDSVGHM
ncbi:orexin receptor type 2-like isoform X2 [Tubulanus polymorphus]|uniref:orexin receptor type 2-like isoform X2 n=1 Tax=Tubulanus polymorphus TaxID=672921 RepID=UPI003DA4C13F